MIVLSWFTRKSRACFVWITLHIIIYWSTFVGLCLSISWTNQNTAFKHLYDFHFSISHFCIQLCSLHEPNSVLFAAIGTSENEKHLLIYTLYLHLHEQHVACHMPHADHGMIHFRSTWLQPNILVGLMLHVWFFVVCRYLP